MSQNIEDGVAVSESPCELLAVRILDQEQEISKPQTTQIVEIDPAVTQELAKLELTEECNKIEKSDLPHEPKEASAEEVTEGSKEDEEEEPEETDKLLSANEACAPEEPSVAQDKHQTEAIRAIKKRGSTIDVVNCDETTESIDEASVNNVPIQAAELSEDVVVPVEEDTELFDFREMAAGAMRHAEELVRKMLMHVSWTICHFHALPRWLQDNDFIWQGYRPPLPSFWDCIKSIFSIHTETGNIWTHMLGLR